MGAVVCGAQRSNHGGQAAGQAAFARRGERGWLRPLGTSQTTAPAEAPAGPHGLSLALDIYTAKARLSVSVVRWQIAGDKT